MKIGVFGKLISLLAFGTGLGMSTVIGAAYWQSLLAGSVFAIWICFMNIE